jgi:hypothetical protein
MATCYESFPQRRRLVIPLERKAQATEAVGDELLAPKADNFTKGETNAGQVVAIGDDCGFP